MQIFDLVTAWTAAVFCILFNFDDILTQETDWILLFLWVILHIFLKDIGVLVKQDKLLLIRNVDDVTILMIIRLIHVIRILIELLRYELRIIGWRIAYLSCFRIRCFHNERWILNIWFRMNSFLIKYGRLCIHIDSNPRKSMLGLGSLMYLICFYIII